jgi:hypothetical protein
MFTPAIVVEILKSSAVICSPRVHSLAHRASSEWADGRLAMPKCLRFLECQKDGRALRTIAGRMAVGLSRGRDHHCDKDAGGGTVQFTHAVRLCGKRVEGQPLRHWNRSDAESAAVSGQRDPGESARQN